MHPTPQNSETRRCWSVYEEQRSRTSTPVWMRQSWRDLLFLHWPVDPVCLEEALPPGLTLDTYDGKAWLGIVPFRMCAVRPTGLPPLPWVSWFLELNVRTYVRDRLGRPGVWFYSLDCNQPLAVAAARRWFHLNYLSAEMGAHRITRGWHYRCLRKRQQETALYEFSDPGDAVSAPTGSLEFFLLERYRLFTCDATTGCLLSGRVWHQPYLTSAVNLIRYSTAPFRWNNLHSPSTPPVHVLHCSGVDVAIHGLEKVA